MYRGVDNGGMGGAFPSIYGWGNGVTYNHPPPPQVLVTNKKIVAGNRD